MAQVPYSGAPSVGPSGQAIGGVATSAPADAFGANVAGAIGELGGAVGKAGDVVFARALAMQELANQSAARDADANYIMDVGDLQAQFNSLQGPQAMAALPKYKEDLNNLRVKYSESLNPAARRLFESSARNTLARTVFNGASHAATQNRQWAKDTLVAEMQLAAKTVDDNTDDVTFMQQQTKVRKAANELSILNGDEPDSPRAQLNALTQQSALWKSRIIGISRTDPEAAMRMLDANKTAMTQQDFLVVDQSVRQQSRAITSQNIAESIYDPNKTLDQLVEEARKKAKEANPNDPLLERNTVTAIKGFDQIQRAARRSRDFEDRQTLAKGIQAGYPNLQAALADPQFRAAYDRLPPTEQNKVPSQIANYNKKVNEYEAGELDTRLRGLSNTDVEAYLNTDIMSEKLTKQQKDFHLERQAKLKEKATGDPRVLRAVGQLRAALGPQLQALGVYSRTKDNIQQYDQFVGALQTALDVFQEDNKRPAGYKDIVETIGPALIQQRTEKGWLWNSQRPFYDQDVPREFSDRVTADVLARGGQTPTPEQIQRAYIRAQYVKLYGKKEVKDGTRIPQSGEF